MKLLFFSVTKHQYNYFEKLKKHLDLEATHTFFPNLNLSFRSMTIDSSEILNTKYKELDSKYTNSLHKLLYKILLNIQIPWLSRVIYKQLTVQKPQFLLVWNGKKFHQAIAVEVAKSLGIPSVYFENGLLPDTTTMDFKGVNVTNSLPRHASFYENLQFDKTLTLPTQLIPRLAKKKKRSFKNTFQEHYIFVPFQVAYDTQIIQNSPHFKNMFELFKTLEWLTERTNIHFIIKEHPSDKVSDYSALHQITNSQIHFSSDNTQQLIENATAVMSINSSVAIESLLLKKRVIVLGEAFFTIDGIVKKAHSNDEILTVLNTLESWELKEDLIEKFLKHLYFNYLIPGSWKEPTSKHYSAIKSRLKEMH